MEMESTPRREMMRPDETDWCGLRTSDDRHSSGDGTCACVVCGCVVAGVACHCRHGFGRAIGIVEAKLR